MAGEGLAKTLQLMQQLQRDAQKDVDSAIKAQGGAGSKLQQAMSQEVNRKFRNPGQSGLDVLGGQNQTGIQNQALMMMGANMMEHGYGNPGLGLSRGVQAGLNTLNTLRDNQKQTNVANAKAGYEIATDQLTAAKDRRANIMASQGGTGGLLTNTDIPSAVREGMALDLMTEEERANYFASKRQSNLVDMGGGVMGRVNPITGQLEPVTLPGQTREAFRNEFSQAEANQGRAQAYAEASGKGQAGIDVAFQEAMTNEMPEIQSYLNELKQLRNSIASGELANTGAFTGRFMKFIDGKVAAFNASSVEAAIKLLAEANLQPVSDQEFATIQGAVANVLNEPEANLALLERQIEKLEKAMSVVASKSKYFRENGGTLSNWGLYEFELRQRELEERANSSGGSSETGKTPGEVDLGGL